MAIHSILWCWCVYPDILYFNMVTSNYFAQSYRWLSSLCFNGIENFIAKRTYGYKSLDILTINEEVCTITLYKSAADDITDIFVESILILKLIFLSLKNVFNNDKRKLKLKFCIIRSKVYLKNAPKNILFMNVRNKHKLYNNFQIV